LLFATEAQAEQSYSGEISDDHQEVKRVQTHEPFSLLSSKAEIEVDSSAETPQD
jgi:hypothetical protein